MRISVTVTRRIVKIRWPPGIDYNKLAAQVGVHPQVAWNWLKTGSVPERYLPIIKGIPLELVK